MSEMGTMGDRHRASLRHPITGKRVYLSSPDLASLRRRKAFLLDVRRELATSARCPHCGAELASRVTAAEAGAIFDGAGDANVGVRAAKRVRLLPAIERQIAEREPWQQPKARAVYNNQFKPYFARGVRVLELEPARVRAWLSALERDGYSRKTMRDAFDALGAAYRRLVRSRTVPPRPPWEGVERPRVPRSSSAERLPPSRDEFVRLILAVAVRSPERARLYLFAALTGLRNGELVALAWEDWDGAELLHVRHNAVDHWRKYTPSPRPLFPVKGKRAAVQRLHPQAVEVLRKQRASLEARGHFRGDGPMWPDAGGAFRPNNNAIRSETIQRDAQRAGVGPVSAHVLRHAHATFEAEAGAPAIEIQGRLRHRSLTTTEGYLHARRATPSRTTPFHLEIPD